MLTSRLGGRLLVLAAPVLLAAELVRSDHSQSSYAAQLADVANARTPELLAAALFLLGGLLLIPAAIGLARITSGRGSHLITAGSVLFGVAAIWMSAGRAMFALMLYTLTQPHFARDTAVGALTQIGNSSAFAIFLLPLLALLLAPIVLGLGLWRARLAPWWPVAVWPIATAAFLTLERNTLGDVVTFGAMTGVIAAIGLAASRHHPEPRTKARFLKRPDVLRQDLATKRHTEQPSGLQFGYLVPPVPGTDRSNRLLPQPTCHYAVAGGGQSSRTAHGSVLRRFPTATSA